VALLNKAAKGLVTSSNPAENVDADTTVFHVDKRMDFGQTTKVRVDFYYFDAEKKLKLKPSYPESNDSQGWLQLYQSGESVCNSYLEQRRQARTRSMKRQKLAPDLIEIDINKLETILAGKMKQKPLEEYQWSSFDATEHKNIFMPQLDETLEECLDRRISLLTKAGNNVRSGYKMLIPGGDPNDYYTSGQKAIIYRRGVFMRRAYIAIGKGYVDGH